MPHAERMAVLRSAEVIQTVGKSERLGIGQAFAQLFDAPVDVAAVYVELFDDFAFERYAEAEHARAWPGAEDRC